MDKKRLKIAYVPPRTEAYAAEPNGFLAVSPGGFAGGASFGEYFGGSAGSASFGNSGSGSGGSAGGASFEGGFGGGGGSAGQATFDDGAGAKTVILGREFSFSNPWN